MKWSVNAIQRVPMDGIVGFDDTDETLSLNVDDPAQREHRAQSFRDWLVRALPEPLKEYICFVDYTVFQDPKVNSPYFYLVSPSENTTKNYRRCVENLVEGGGDTQDCFSVAYHPDFVGITVSQNSNSHWIISLEQQSGRSPLPATDSHSKVENWIPDLYPLWLKNKETVWPPTTAQDLIRVCGKHSLQECLERFRKILKERRHQILDSMGRPVNFVFCIPFLVANHSPSYLKSNLPFSEIAGALFLGVSFEGQSENIDRAMEFVRTLALRTYRAAGVSNAVATGLDRGLKEAIETFAHQIKSVANAMNKTWLMRFDKWEQVRLGYPEKSERIAEARVLPAPQLFQAVRDTLVLWSQTRRLTDIYPAWPTSFTQIVNRAWSLASSADFTFSNMSRNFEADAGELIKVWEQESLMNNISVAGSDVPVDEFPSEGMGAERWICDVTRLLTAIFDNSLVHGVRGTAPTVSIALKLKRQESSKEPGKEISVMIANKIDRPVETTDSRLRVGMKGEDVLRYLESQLKAKLELPEPPHDPGTTYLVTATIPLPKREEWS